MPFDFKDPNIVAGVVALSSEFASGRVTPVAVLDTYLDRIERLNPRVNAFLAVDTERARLDARASRARWAAGRPLSPLDGAAIGVKANIAVEGLPWHAGMAAHAGRVAERDAECVAALRGAGAVIVGILNMHEAALGATNDNLAFGRCHNPFREDFTPGGSSGGSAAAVAAGLCAAAVGTDTLGSVRIPASYCGVFGHKPVHGLIPMGGIVPLSWTLDDVGVLARSASDCGALLDVMSGGAPLQPNPVEDETIRWGVIDLSPHVTLDGAVAEAFERTIDDARASGWSVQRLNPPGWDARAMRRLSLMIVEVEALVEHQTMLEENPAGFSSSLSGMLLWAARQSAAQAATAYRELGRAAEALRRDLSEFDAILMPTTASPAFAFDHAAPIGQADLTLLANISGLAATAFPLGLAPDGLPLSAQILSASDETAIRLASLIAKRSPAPETFL
jgi:aspartyl-tRNA(Asn)/glutamyl-tRNA(Gln) amidotransferase subunit A